MSSASEGDDAPGRQARARPLDVVGVLLAAGRGRRMGTLKQILPWAAGSTTVVASAFDGLAVHCNRGMIVVVGAEPDRVIAALGSRSFERVDSDPDAEQFCSVRLGLKRARRKWPRGTHVLLHPGDHPVIPVEPIRLVLARAAQPPTDATPAVIIPTHRGRGGHPVLIASRLVDRIVRWSGSGGLRGFWRENPGQCQRIEYPEAPHLTLDLDTPEQYRAANS